MVTSSLPLLQYPDSRLDRVIGKIAARGVKVYILQYKEPKVMPMQSAWTRECFLSLNQGHSNIQFLRHGDITFPYMWSHHEKLVVIDQDLAYVGGVDLCLGRWDNEEYRLRDDGPENKRYWPGKEYQNPRIKDYADVNKTLEDNPVTGVARDSIPRMPRRDVHMRVFGQTALDVSWHFVQRWNYTRYVGKASKFVDPLTISGAAASDMLSSDHEHRQHLNHNYRGPSKFDDDVALSPSYLGIGGGSTNFAKILSTSMTSPDSRKVSLVEMDEPISRLSSANFTSQREGYSGRRKSLIDSIAEFMRRGSIAERRDSTSEELVKSLTNDAWDKNIEKKRRQSIMEATIELNGKEVKVEDVQEEVSSIPFSLEEDDKQNPRLRIAEALDMQLAGRQPKHRRMSAVTANDAAYLPTNETPTEPSDSRFRRERFMTKIMVNAGQLNSQQKASDAPKKADKSHPQSPVGTSACEPAVSSEEEEEEEEEEEAMRDKTGSKKSWDSLNEVNYNHVLGDDYAPKGSCTGDIIPTRCHVLRSIGRWSAGVLDTEKGIADAYKYFIESSQHYIYIENQFFVTGMRGNGRVTNTLAQSLYSRIMKAAVNKSKFKVLVLIPLLPAMEGPVKGGALSSIAGVMYWQYRSICRGGGSLLEQLRKDGVDPFDYIKFIGLRTYDKMSTGWQTEMIYIRSKLMIVDDRVAIIGSANMNDRSMVGSKDSELCILTEDTQMVASKMGGSDFQAGRFCKSLRLKCWAEFCGIHMDDKDGLKNIDDPSSDETWTFLQNLASNNTAKYEQVFKDLVPSNRIQKKADLRGDGLHMGEVKEADFRRRLSVSCASVPSDETAEKLNNNSLMQTRSRQRKKEDIAILHDVKGLMVEWPLDFLKEDFKSLHPTALPGEMFK